MKSKTFRKSHERKIKTKSSASSTRTVKVKSTFAKVGKRSSGSKKN